MRDLIIGAGGVGLGIGSALLAAGRDITFVARGETHCALAANGLSRTGVLGKARFAPTAFQLIGSIDACSERPRTILIAVKTLAAATVAHALARNPILRSVPIVLFQNGIGNAEQFAHENARDRISNASVMTGFRRPSPSEVDITVHGREIQLGSLWCKPSSEIDSLAAAITAGGIPCVVTPDIASEIYAKLLYNAALNPLATLFSASYGELGSRKETRNLMNTVFEEVFAVLRARGETIRWSSAAEYADFFYRDVLPPTAAHRSSMQQDIAAGRPTEIDSLCGEIVRRGKEVGVPTPVNAALTTLVHELEAREGPVLSALR